MDKLFSPGRWIFPLSFLLYVGLHFGKPDTGADFVPDFLPWPYFWNYATGLCVLLFIAGALTKKYARLATTLMIGYVLLVTLLVHVPRAAGDEMDMLNIFRNIMVIGALMVFGKGVPGSG